jgi:hypothetical protein
MLGELSLDHKLEFRNDCEIGGLSLVRGLSIDLLSVIDQELRGGQIWKIEKSYRNNPIFFNQVIEIGLFGDFLRYVC